MIHQNTYNEEVDARIRVVTEAVVAKGKVSIWNAHAFLLAEGADPSEIHGAVENHLAVSTFAPNQSIAGGPFHVLPAMLLVSRWENRLLPETIERIRRFFVEGIIDRGNTENHWLMHYTGNLLAAERWSDEAQLWNGLTPAAVHAEAKRWISGMIDRTALTGHHEYDSTGYIAEHVTPLIGIAEYAGDDELREKAKQALALLFADMALEYFHGAWAGSHSREGYRVNTWTESGTVRGFHYLYFGDREFDAHSHLQGFTIPNTVASYRPPAQIISMAFDRDTPFVVRKTKAPRTINRHVNRESGPVRKYTYMSRSFALGSSRLNLPGAPAGPIDLTSWDLTWDGPKHHAKIVCNHPFRSPKRFSAFLPNLPQTAEREIGSGKPYLQYPDRLFGASPYERMMQHRGSVIVVYRIPEDDRDPYVNLYLPKGLQWREKNGWLFADVYNHCRNDEAGASGVGTSGVEKSGDGANESDASRSGEKSRKEGRVRFFVAVYPIGDYRWRAIRESVASNILVKDGDLIDGWLLRIEDTKPGIVLEAVEADELEPVGTSIDARGAPGSDEFDAFVEQRSRKIPEIGEWFHNGRVRFTTCDGREMDMSYDGPHLIDGRPIDYESWPLFEAPWVQAGVGDGKVVFEKDGNTLEVDVRARSDEPLIPMRVIG